MLNILCVTADNLQEKYDETIASLAEMEKRVVMAETMLEATLQYQSGQDKVLPSPRYIPMLTCTTFVAVLNTLSYALVIIVFFTDTISYLVISLPLKLLHQLPKDNNMPM